MPNTIDFAGKVDSVKTAGTGDEGEYIVTIRIPHNDVKADVLGARLLSLKRNNTVYAFNVHPEHFQIGLFDSHAPYLEEELASYEPDPDDDDDNGSVTATTPAPEGDPSDEIHIEGASLEIEGLSDEERAAAVNLGYLSEGPSRTEPATEDEAAEQEEAMASLAGRSR